MTVTSMYRALADDTRRQIVTLLLGHNYCVSELARVLGISESAVSQHLKVLKEVDLLCGEKRGHYMHYDIDREKLLALAREIVELAGLERKECTGPASGCGCAESGDGCTDDVKFFCHGTPGMDGKVKLKMTPAGLGKE